MLAETSQMPAESEERNSGIATLLPNGKARWIAQGSAAKAPSKKVRVDALAEIFPSDAPTATPAIGKSAKKATEAAKCNWEEPEGKMPIAAKARESKKSANEPTFPKVLCRRENSPIAKIEERIPPAISPVLKKAADGLPSLPRSESALPSQENEGKAASARNIPENAASGARMPQAAKIFLMQSIAIYQLYFQ